MKFSKLFKKAAALCMAAVTTLSLIPATWSYVKKKYKLNVTNFLPFVDSFD